MSLKMGNRTYLNFEVRQILQGINNTWRVLYPNMTKYQVMKMLLLKTINRQQQNNKQRHNIKFKF
jgi:hypothetical protein